MTFGRGVRGVRGGGGGSGEMRDELADFKESLFTLFLICYSRQTLQVFTIELEAVRTVSSYSVKIEVRGQKSTVHSN